MTESVDLLSQKEIGVAAGVVSIASFVCFAAVYGLRYGLGDSIFSVASVFVFALLPIWASAVFLCVPSVNLARTVLYSTSALALGELFPALGLELGSFATALAALAVLGAWGWFIAVRRAWLAVPRAATAAAAIGLGILLTISLSWERVLLPELLQLGLANTDNLFHLARAQMLLHYGLSTFGADGLIYTPYHFGTHLIAAGLSRASRTAPVFVYTYWAELALRVQLIWAIYVAGVLLARLAGQRFSLGPVAGLYFALLFLVLSNTSTSESMLMGLTLFAAAMPFYAWLFRAESAGQEFPWGFVLALLLAFILAFAKVSAGFFGAIAVVWISWVHRRHYVFAIVAIVGLLLLAVTTVVFLVGQDGMVDVAITDLIASYLQYATVPTVLSYGLPALLLLMPIYRISISRAPAGDVTAISIGRLRPPATRTGWFAWFRPFDNSGIELLAVTFAACVIVLLAVPLGGDVVAFSNILFEAAFVMLPLYFVGDRLLDLPSFRVAATLSAVLLGVVALSHFTLDELALSAKIYAALGVPSGQDSAISKGRSLIATRSPWGLLRGAIDATPWENFVRDLDRRREADPTLVVHVTPDAAELWTRLKDNSPWWCMAAHLQVPAEAGIIEIRSMEPVGMQSQCAPPGYLMYAFGGARQHFGDLQAPHRTGSQSDDDLCAATRALRAREIYSVSSISDLSKNRIIQCKAN